MMKIIEVITAVVLLSLTQLPARAAVPESDPAQDQSTTPEVPALDFSGRWVLSTEDSDEPLQAMRPASPQKGGRGGGTDARGGGRGGGRPGMGGRSGGPGGDSEGIQEGEDPSIRRQQHQARLQKRLSRLDIFFAEPELNITDGLEISRLVYTDGRETAIWTELGEATAIASRQENTLTVKTWDRQGGPHVVRRYTLSGDGGRLTVVQEMTRSAQEEPVKMTLVYDRQE